MTQDSNTGDNGSLSVERIRQKLGEKEVQILLYEQIIEQYHYEIRELKQKLRNYE